MLDENDISLQTNKMANRLRHVLGRRLAFIITTTFFFHLVLMDDFFDDDMGGLSGNFMDKDTAEKLSCKLKSINFI